VVSDGSYGVARGIVSSFPLRSKGGGGYEIVQGIKLDAFAKAKVDATIAELEKERDIVKDLLA
jgi:malate dehydrogenase